MYLPLLRFIITITNTFQNLRPSLHVLEQSSLQIISHSYLVGYYIQKKILHVLVISISYFLENFSLQIKWGDVHVQSGPKVSGDEFLSLCRKRSSVGMGKFWDNFLEHF